ncbi:hypothetical protein [Rufibacter roseus]|uniref:HTTM domain-containing protein n=1 Tax=Rufibacter roseus TaxID=1567108 RepID=A0ABW2DFD3_9BACT|nr:hypothetical protein [Rufibacter roseus]
MTPSLLPVSSKMPNIQINTKELDLSGVQQRLRTGVDFFYAETALRIFTFVWLYWAWAKFEVLLQRPAVLFTPEGLISECLIPALPGKEVFLGVIAIAAAMNGVKFIWRSSLLAQVVLALCLLWINLIIWSYGYLPNVNHLFLLAHLFLVFACFNKSSLFSGKQEVSTGINWFYLGLLFTYSLAGTWKVAALAYKLLTSSTDVHWLKPEAALYNALVNFRDNDLPLTFAPLFTDYAWVWQLGFVGVTYLQATSIWAAWRPTLRPWVGAFLICFHLLNQFAFLVSFVVACLVLLCLFFPYSLFLNKVIKAQHVQTSWGGSRREASYKRQYPSGEQDGYVGFEAYRQRLLDKNYYLFGILYLPGIRTVVEAWWWLQSKIVHQVNRTS